MVDPQDTAIVSSIIALAKTLCLQVTGEGIETLAQRDHLQEMGCDQGQGYLFARPLPPRELGLMLGAAARHAPFALAA